MPGWDNDLEKAAINGELREVLEEGLSQRFDGLEFGKFSAKGFEIG